MAIMPASNGGGALRSLARELPLLVGALTVAVMFTIGEPWFDDPSNLFHSGLLFAWIFLVMLWCSFGVVRHADHLAEALGEPYGTLILTLAVITIEVALISAIMLTGADEPKLARDTMFAVLMIVLNGMVGLVLLVGGLRHRQQEFNVAGANAFLAVLVPLSVFSLVLPSFTRATPDPSLSPMQAGFFAAVTVVLYGIFLTIQTVRHRRMFVAPSTEYAGSESAGEEHPASRGFIAFHAVLLVATMLPIVLLSKKLAVFVDYGVIQLEAPRALGGLIVAILVLTPEGLSALQASLANQLQRSVNICLGSAVATIGLTVPAVLGITLVTGAHVELGLDQVDMTLLGLTILVSMLTFGGGRTNILQGAVHIVLFFAYLMLIFDP
ncbi:MAG: calcium:proton antiporter [Pseudomonadota bacterium]